MSMYVYVGMCIWKNIYHYCIMSFIFYTPSSRNKQLKMDPRKINIKNVKDYQMMTVEDCQKQC